MLEEAALAPSPLKPVTRLLVSEKTCTRQWIVTGVGAVVVANTCALPMKPTVELVDTAVESYSLQRCRLGRSGSGTRSPARHTPA